MASAQVVSIWGPVRQEPARGPVIAGPIRLTDRGKTLRAGAILLCLVALVVAIAIGATTGQAWARQANDLPTVRLVPSSVVVGRGDSLWLIASRAQPGADPREVVNAIRDVNNLSSNLIQPGDVLVIPSGK